MTDIWAYDPHIDALYLSKLSEEEIGRFAEDGTRRQFKGLVYFYGELIMENEADEVAELVLQTLRMAEFGRDIFTNIAKGLTMNLDEHVSVAPDEPKADPQLVDRIADVLRHRVLGGTTTRISHMDAVSMAEDIAQVIF